MIAKKKSLIINLVMAAIIVFIAFLFWPSSKSEYHKQSNDIDRNKTQIKILVKRVNIRKNPTIISEDIGDVYKDEIYTVLDCVETNEYYWYKIKTGTGIEGYIASDKKDEYVEVISGYIDRTPPVIKVKNDYLVFINGKKDYSDVTCEEEYTTCTLSYDEKNRTYIKITAKDEAGNTSEKEVNYYNVYDLHSENYDNSSTINAKLTKSKSGNKYIIKGFYKINKDIKNESKSSSYSPVVMFYDDDFKEMSDVMVWYNNETLPDYCINNENMELKEEYLDKDLIKGDTLCINYTFEDQTSNIKYVTFGFYGIENYGDDSNILANYYSKYFILNK